MHPTFCNIHYNTRRAIRKPFGKVYFAGTETAVKWNGYMDGAVESGERAAREVLHAMGKISEDQIWQEEPPSPDVPHTPFEDNPLEKILPSVPQFLIVTCSNNFFVSIGNKLAEEFKKQTSSLLCPEKYKKLGSTFLLKELDAPAALITLHGGLSLRHSFQLLGAFDKLQTIASKNNYYRLSFFPRTIKEWNELEPSVAEAKSTSQFKAELGRASLH
ncbi:hypothetical protein Bbelb_433140 [Branchiostoma belcheri]|nr:hypothetical protein Bbelb_433140 [Branchiostoma belcheri]